MLKDIKLEEYRSLFKTKILSFLPLNQDFYDRSVISTVSSALAAYLHHQYIAIQELERQTDVATATGKSLEALGSIIGVTRGIDEDDNSLRFRIQRRINTPTAITADYYAHLIEQCAVDKNLPLVRGFCMFSRFGSQFLESHIDADTLRICYILKDSENPLSDSLLQHEPWIFRTLKDAIPFQFKVEDFRLVLKRIPIVFDHTPTDTAEITRIMQAVRRRVLQEFDPFPDRLRRQAEATEDEQKGIGTTRISLKVLNETLKEEAGDLKIFSPTSIQVNADQYPYLYHEGEAL